MKGIISAVKVLKKQKETEDAEFGVPYWCRLRCKPPGALLVWRPQRAAWLYFSAHQHHQTPADSTGKIRCFKSTTTHFCCIKLQPQQDQWTFMEKSLKKKIHPPWTMNIPCLQFFKDLNFIESLTAFLLCWGNKWTNAYSHIRPLIHSHCVVQSN